MTQAAQSALRRGELPRLPYPILSELTRLQVIEQFTKNVRFCIICNYVNKIIPAVQSRCTRFRFVLSHLISRRQLIRGFVASVPYQSQRWRSG
mgnify:FL=1